MEAALACSQAAVFYGGWKTVDETGETLQVRPPEALPQDVFHTLLTRSHLVSHAAMVRRSALACSGLYDVRLPACEDWDLRLRLAAAGGEFVLVPDSMVAYRRYPGTMSTEFDRMWKGGLAVLRKNLSHHPRCARCRRAAARGRWFLARYCLPLLLPPHTQEQGSSLPYRRMFLASLRSPRIGALILRQASRHAIVRPLSACLAHARRGLPVSPDR
jgi:GT2 family glycosyltransferase